MDERRVDGGSVGRGEGVGKESLVAAIWVRREARRRSSSEEGYECMSKDGLE